MHAIILFTIASKSQSAGDSLFLDDMSFVRLQVSRLRSIAVWGVFLAEMGALVILISSLSPFLITYLVATRFISWLYRVLSLFLRLIWIRLKPRHRGTSKNARSQWGPAKDQSTLLPHFRAAPLINILPGLTQIKHLASELPPEGETRLKDATARLDASASEIRLASVLDVPHPSEGEASSSSSLRLELSVVSLDKKDDEPEFFVICHAPGESTTITVDQQRTEASHGLLGGNDTPVYIWAGEVCVNKHDPAECDSQSVLLPRIYQQAKKVIIWLGGPADNQARCLFAFIRVWSSTLVEWKEWTGSFKPALPLLIKLDEVMRTAWKTWDEPLVSTSLVNHAAPSPGAVTAAAAITDYDQTVRNGEAEIGLHVESGMTELSPITALLGIFGRLPYWAHPQGFRHSCDPKDCIILCDKQDIVVGLSEVSRVFLWISNFGRDLVADGQRPESISTEVWDVLNVLVVEIPNLPIFQYLVVEEDRLR